MSARHGEEQQQQEEEEDGFGHGWSDSDGGACGSFHGEKQRVRKRSIKKAQEACSGGGLRHR